MLKMNRRAAQLAKLAGVPRTHVLRARPEE